MPDGEDEPAPTTAEPDDRSGHENADHSDDKWWRWPDRWTRSRLTHRGWMRGCLALSLLGVYALFGLVILWVNHDKPNSELEIALITSSSTALAGATGFFFGTGTGPKHGPSGGE